RMKMKYLQKIYKERCKLMEKDLIRYFVDHFFQFFEQRARGRGTGLIANQLNALPTRVYNSAHQQSVIGNARAAVTDDTECVICLEQFTGGENLRFLPCCHKYHRRCIDNWLKHSIPVLSMKLSVTVSFREKPLAPSVILKSEMNCDSNDGSLVVW
ncbi:hypothetical protein LSH36_485g02048, partial [Paralvinella palmiformis]